MSKEQTPQSPTAEIIKHIRENGDVIDQDARYKRPFGLIAMTATGFASGILPGVNAYSINLEAYGSTPVYSAGLGVLSAATYAGVRWRDGQRQQKAEADQASIREALREPVDIIRSGKKKSRQLLLRWHGADNTVDANRTYDMTGRLHKVAEFAEREGIPRIAIGADWLQDIVGKEEGATKYGVLINGADAVRNQKSMRGIATRVKDLQVDQRVLVSSTAEAKKLVKKLETVEMQGLVKDLMLQVADDVVTRSYKSLLKSETSPEDFKRIVHAALEREYNQHDTASKRREWDKVGGVQRIQKVSSYKTVRGGMVHSSESWYDHESSTAQQAYGGETDLLRAQGVRTFNELMEKLTIQNNVTDQRGVLTAVYLALQQPVTTTEDLSDRKSDENPTLFQRMATEKLRTFRTWQKPRSGEDGPTLRYTSDLSRTVYGMLGTAALTAGPIFGALPVFPAHTYESHVEDSMELRHDAAQKAAIEKHGPQFLDADGRFDSEKFDGAYYKALKEAGDSYDQKYLNAYKGIKDFDRNISSYMVDKYLHALKPLTNQLDAHEFAKWRMTAFKSTPPGEYVSSDGKGHIGDSPNGKNGDKTPIYTIGVLGGKPVDGYWYGSVYTSMEVGPDGLSYNDGSWDHSSEEWSPTISPETIPWSQGSIDQQKPDYLVETPYLLGEGGNLDNKKPLILPIKQNGSIIAMRIVDKFDPSKAVNEVPFEVQTANGTARLQMTDKLIDQMRDTDIESPKLQYWIKIQSDKTILASNMSYPDGIDMDSVGRDIRKTLGLPERASQGQVLRKIRDSKDYSYTPLEDAHEDLKTHSDNSQDQLREIATTLAELDTLNCNLAQTLMSAAIRPTNHYTVADGYPTDSYDSNLDAVSGYHVNGDGVISEDEAHAWLLNRIDNEEVDPTPVMTEKYKKSITPTSMEVQEPWTLPFDGITKGTFGALMVLTAWRRREQIKRKMDATRSYYVTAGKGASEAINLIEAAHYGRPDSQIKPRVMNPEQVRDSVLNNIPIGGLSPEKVRARLEQDGISAPLSFISRIALESLYRNDAAIRRAVKRPTAAKN